MKHLLKQKRNFFLLAWVIGIALIIVAKNNSEIGEFYFARGMYRAFSGLMIKLTGNIPFSLAEVILVLFASFMLTYIVTGIIGIVRAKGHRGEKTFLLFRFILIISGLIFCICTVGGGTNYYRYEFTEFSGLEVRESTKEELVNLCINLVEKTNSAREELAVYVSENNKGRCDKDSPFISGLTHEERAKACSLAMRSLGKKYEVLEGDYPKAKAVILSRLMSEFNITGVYFPVTVEANVNVDVPDCEKAATICHELTHIRGFMREDEANYLGYLSCVKSGNPELVYSGYLMALTHACNRLYDADSEAYFEIRELISDGVIEDQADKSRYWKQFDGTVAQKVGETVNDTYLKLNSQEDGTKSYGRMVDLLLAEYRNEEV